VTIPPLQMSNSVAMAENHANRFSHSLYRRSEPALSEAEVTGALFETALSTVGK